MSWWRRSEGQQERLTEVFKGMGADGVTACAGDDKETVPAAFKMAGLTGQGERGVWPFLTRTAALFA